MKSIFSKIINKEIPCHLISENNNSIAFLDINPIAIGHVLVVPKLEVDYLFDLDSKIYSDLWDFSKAVACALKKTIPCKKIGVSVIGLEVPHAHIHLVPINHIHDINFQNKINLSSSDLESLAKKITSNI
tara:strand:+ start:4071 stop:4460 length:390 start_codon:yes stop_codon:yes gene_type:complete